MMITTLTALLATAQLAEAPKAKLTLPETEVVAGSLVKGTVSLTFAPGLHGYQNPPSEDYMIPVEIKSVEGATKLSVRYPAGHPAAVGGELDPVMTYSGTVEIPVLVRIPEVKGSYEFKIAVGYQQCNDQACYPPGTVSVTGAVNVTPKPESWNSVKRRSHDLLVMGRQADSSN